MYIGRIIEINSFEAGIANAKSMNDEKLLRQNLTSIMSIHIVNVRF